ncbi:MAG: hypothetical protein ABII01_00680 [Candidatus Woesearchaeota archaeon]
MIKQEYLFKKEEISKKNDNFISPSSKLYFDLLRSNIRPIKNNDCCQCMFLPLSIFNNDSLSGLETISKFMKEEIGLSCREIASILNRDERTIWGSYQSSRKKMQQRFPEEYSKFYIPLTILRNRSLSVLEAITAYLKDELSLRYCRIASLLNRDDRTIWTVYYRVKKKRRMENEPIQL